MKANSQGGQGEATTFTVRLDEALAERLRVISFQRRAKKQPLMRQALVEFLKSKPDVKALQTFAEPAGGKPRLESLRLEPPLSKRLGQFALDHRLKKQVIVYEAVRYYLDQLEKPTPAPKRK